MKRIAVLSFLALTLGCQTRTRIANNGRIAGLVCCIERYDLSDEPSDRQGAHSYFIGELSGIPDSIQLSLLTQVTGDNAMPAMSRDRSKIAYIANRSGNDELWICDRDGKENKQATFNKYEKSSPVWNNGSDRIYFMQKCNGAWQIACVHLGDRTVQVVVEDPTVNLLDPEALPGDTAILYVAAAGTDTALSAWRESTINRKSLRTGQTTVLVKGGSIVAPGFRTIAEEWHTSTP